MEVLTNTVKVRQMRRMIVELLLARCPEMPALQTLARRMGVEISSFKKRDAKECILCGLCVRFCEEVVGVSAIGLSNRGTDREVSTPFKAVSDVCIGCGSCTYICPTGCIEMVNDGKRPGIRSMHMGNLLLKPCPNDYKCTTCDIEQQFIEKMKNAVTHFRSKFHKDTEL
jgi:ferredoxin